NNVKAILFREPSFHLNHKGLKRNTSHCKLEIKYRCEATLVDGLRIIFTIPKYRALKRLFRSSDFFGIRDKWSIGSTPRMVTETLSCGQKPSFIFSDWNR